MWDFLPAIIKGECWNILYSLEGKMSLYYFGSCPQSYVKEYKTNIPYLLWISLLLVGILYKEMIKMRIILSHMQYVRVIPPYLLVYNNANSAS